MTEGERDAIRAGLVAAAEGDGDAGAVARDALVLVDDLARQVEQARITLAAERAMRTMRVSGDGVLQPDWNAMWRQASVVSGYWVPGTPSAHMIPVVAEDLRLLDADTHLAKETPVFVDWNAYDVPVRWFARILPGGAEARPDDWFPVTEAEARAYLGRWGGNEAPSGRMEVARFVHERAFAEARQGREAAERDAGLLARRLSRAVRAGSWQAPYRSLDASGSDGAAATVGWAWLDAVAIEEKAIDPAALAIETPPREGDGAVAVLYRGTEPVAMFVVWRDPLNYAVLLRWRAGKAPPT